MKKQIKITKLDYKRLSNLIHDVKDSMRSDIENILTLRHEIERAKKVEPREISSKYITMNSEFEIISLDLQKVMKFKLVYPQEANFSKGKLSVLSPLGCALIGCEENDEVEYKVPTGIKKVKIEKILYQPEEVGEFYL